MAKTTHEEFDKIFNDGNERTQTAFSIVKSIGGSPSRITGPWHGASVLDCLLGFAKISKQIRFGDKVELATTKILENAGLISLPKDYPYNGEILCCDQVSLYEKDNKIFFIEQKLNDDHDSTKRRGQFDNFVKKIKCLTEEYPDKHIVAIMWFCNTGLRANGRFYSNNMASLNYDCHLCYGEELFLQFNELGGKEEYDNFYSYLEKRRSTMDASGKTDVNFDTLSMNDIKDIVLRCKEMVGLSPVKKFINDQELVKEVHSIVSPNGTFIKLLQECYFDLKNKKNGNK